MMDLEELPNKFRFLSRRISLMNKIVILITSISSFWFILKVGFYSLKFGIGYEYLVLAIILIIITIGMLALGDGAMDSKSLAIFRIICVLALIHMGIFEKTYFPISLIIFTITLLFHLPLEVIWRRMVRTFTFSSVYAHRTDYESILYANIIYMEDRIKWLFNTHAIVLGLSLIIFILVKIFEIVDGIIPPAVSQFVGLTTMFAILYMVIARVYRSNLFK